MPFHSCANPLRFANHRKVEQKKLTVVTEDFKKSYPQINWSDGEIHHICPSCRLYVRNGKPGELEVTEVASASSSSPLKKKLKSAGDELDLDVEDGCYAPQRWQIYPKEMSPEQKNLKELNSQLSSMDISPIKKTNLRSAKAIERKSRDIGTKVLASVLGSEKVKEQESKNGDLNALMGEIIKKFNDAANYEEKLQLLTLAAAACYSVDQIANLFGTTKYLAKEAIKLFEEHGILAKPKRGPNEKKKEVEAHVKAFYLSDEISKMLPGRKDFVTVREDGQKQQIQKKLLLFKLKTAHEKFDNLNPAIVSFSKFASLRPKQVVLAGSPGTLAQCVCAMHANIDCMFHALQKYLPNCDFKTGTECILASMCNPPQEKCNFRKCDLCPGFGDVMEYFQGQLEDTEKITFGQWVSETRGKPEVLTQTVPDFLSLLEKNLEILQPHRFLVKKQNSYFEHLKTSLALGEILLLCDYAENYAFVIQNAIQANHWQNDQATLHVCVCLYRVEDKMKEINFVSISNYLKHETAAIHLFQERLFLYLRTVLPFRLTKVYYFSDGCPGQYKNRFNFCNLMHHEHDFDCAAEWHFHPTSHGKNLCDGIGGTVKRCAYQESHRRDETQPLNTAHKLHEFVNSNMPKINSDFTTIAQHLAHRRKLRARFEKSPPVEGCRSLHAFVPSSKTELTGKTYSFQEDKEEYKTYDYSFIN